MANIDITDQGGGGGTPINTGVLQLENGVALDTTLRYVTDQTNTKSQLLLATNATTVEGTLKVKTNNVEYLDVEDGSGNNRFTISRPALGQKVALDFASNPVGSTTIVGSIRTYKDGTNLADTMVFREDGNVGIGETTSPSGLLHVDGGANVPRMILDADTNVARIFSFRTNDTQRWAFRIDDNETGTNAGSNFFIRRYNDAGTFIDAPLSINRANGRVSVNERLLIESDSTVATQTSSVIQSSTTNASLVIAPNGTGALIASIPDGTATGGDARGANAVDLQTSRSASNQIASGAGSVLIGGSSNRTNGSRGAAIGGLQNVVGDDGIVGGYLNTVALRSIGTGYSNTASGGHNLVSGWSNTVGGDRSVAFGTGNNVSGYSAFATGENCRATNSRAFAQGNDSQATAVNSIALGNGGYGVLDNQMSLANKISYLGDAQVSRVIYSINTGLVASGGNYTFTGAGLIIPRNSAYGSGVTQAYFCTAKFIYGARDKQGTVTTINNKDCFTAVYNFAAKTTFGSGGAFIGSPTLQLSFSDPNLAATVVSITLGASGQILFNFTPPTWMGGGTIEFRGTLHLEFTEIGLY